jgi:hypothetical protein
VDERLLICQSAGGLRIHGLHLGHAEALLSGPIHYTLWLASGRKSAPFFRIPRLERNSR